jgi:hypothetical protein
MPFISETYRVFIASPSDLDPERIAATQAIEDWNEHAARTPQRTDQPTSTGYDPEPRVEASKSMNATRLIGLLALETVTSNHKALGELLDRCGHGRGCCDGAHEHDL